MLRHRRAHGSTGPSGHEEFGVDHVVIGGSKVPIVKIDFTTPRRKAKPWRPATSRVPCVGMFTLAFHVGLAAEQEKFT